MVFIVYNHYSNNKSYSKPLKTEFCFKLMQCFNYLLKFFRKVKNIFFYDFPNSLKMLIF